MDNIKILKERVCLSNIELSKKGIVIYTWGNVSGLDREKGLVVIKPSGVSYEEMTPDDMVVVNLYTGDVVEGRWKPSSDLDTHLCIYRAYPTIGGVAHTHSINATSFAQAGLDIPALGTTHADYFYGDIPCTRDLTEKEVKQDYELNTGNVIVECLKHRSINPIELPGILVKNHGPFTWGNDAETSVHNAVVLEVIAEMALKTLSLNNKAELKQHILEKHYMRKHGPNAYYGQK